VSERWELQGKALRDPSQIVSHWADADRIHPEAFRIRSRGSFWDLLAQHGIRLLVSREYENFVVCLSGDRNQTFMPSPHPSGIAVDAVSGSVYFASTRNPNEVFEMKPVSGLVQRDDSKKSLEDHPLIPIRSSFYPGSLYIHDLAMLGDSLLASCAGHNSISRLNDGVYEHAWWPKCIEGTQGPHFGVNAIQLNSIAAGSTLEESFFTASADHVSSRRPGHLNFPVDKRGVVFSGRSREPYATGLTRPHSARFHGQDLYVNNSGYGELAAVEPGRINRVAKLPGWTRGLACHNGLAFVGTSRILPRFTQYAPGVNPAKARCGIHAVDLASGAVLGSVVWPKGNQIFGIEIVSETMTTGFPFSPKTRGEAARRKSLFYGFEFAG